jgi:hypothetical protein
MCRRVPNKPKTSGKQAENKRKTSGKQGFLMVSRVSDERAGGSIDSAAVCLGAAGGRLPP